MNLEALQQLDRVVAAAPPERFEMSTFRQGYGCKTAYCAAGWAAVDPWFQANAGAPGPAPAFGQADWPKWAAAFDRWTAFDNLAWVFEISEWTACALFGANLVQGGKSGITREQVRRQIARVRAGQGVVSYLAPAGH